MRAILAALVVVLCAATAQAAPFRNGDFEQGPAVGSTLTIPSTSTALTGWKPLKSGVLYIGAYWQPGSGTRSLHLSTGSKQSGVSQKFDVTAGRLYRVSFLLAGDPATTEDKRIQFRILPAGCGSKQCGEIHEFTFDQSGQTRQNMGWVEHSFTFTAPSPTITMEIKAISESLNGSAAAIDNVRVVEVPAPGAAGLFGVGLAAAALMGRKAAS